MIERFYLKDYLDFKEIELEFGKGLMLFSGASGVGKTVLLNAILGVFGYKDIDAKVAEISCDDRLEFEDIGIENEEINVFKFSKLKSARYFINGSQVSKKLMKNISKNLVDYLAIKEYKEFENITILSVLDDMASKEDREYKGFLERFKQTYAKYKEVEKNLQDILDKERKIEELREFATYEIQKIEDISPKKDEYEELMSLKKSLSKKEKISQSMQNAKMIFEYEHFVQEALTLIEVDSGFFDECLNELRLHFESAEDRLNELEDIDIEEMLDRIEKLSYLKQRYGSIEGALEHLGKKKEELKRYENISYEKERYKKEKGKLLKECNSMCKTVTEKRLMALKSLNSCINDYLNMLYLPDIKLSLNESQLSENGKDSVEIELWGVELQKISSGEFNRLRLAFLSAFNDMAGDKKGGILILDEVDANLSGKESMSIAKVLEGLAKRYQIFAISHQPQLTSKADMHFLVYKENGISKVKEIKDKDKRVEELARMISGDEIHKKAIDFAKSLIGDKHDN